MDIRNYLPTNAMMIWLFTGLIIGVLYRTIDQSHLKDGIIGVIAAGIIGAFQRGLLSNILFKTNLITFDLVSFFNSIIGALILLFLHSLLMKDTKLFKTKTLN